MDEMYTPLKAGKKYGPILGVFLSLALVLGFSLELMDLEEPLSYSNLFGFFMYLIVPFSIIFLGIRHFRKNNEDLLNMGQSVSTALFIGIFGGLLFAITTYIFVSNNGLGIEPKESEVKFLTSPSVLTLGVFMNTIMSSLFYGLISGVILKRGN